MDSVVLMAKVEAIPQEEGTEVHGAEEGLMAEAAKAGQEVTVRPQRKRLLQRQRRPRVVRSRTLSIRSP